MFMMLKITFDTDYKEDDKETEKNEICIDINDEPQLTELGDLPEFPEFDEAFKFDAFSLSESSKDPEFSVSELGH